MKKGLAIRSLPPLFAACRWRSKLSRAVTKLRLESGGSDRSVARLAEIGFESFPFADVENQRQDAEFPAQFDLNGRRQGVDRFSGSGVERDVHAVKALVSLQLVAETAAFLGIELALEVGRIEPNHVVALVLEQIQKGLIHLNESALSHRS